MKLYILDTNVLEIRYFLENVERVDFGNIFIPDVVLWELEDRGSKIISMLPHTSFIFTTSEHISIYKKEIENIFVLNSDSVINLYKGKGTADPLILTHLLHQKRELSRTLNLENKEFCLVTKDRGLKDAAEKLGFEVIDPTDFIDILKVSA